jgi:hypothetical protein
VQITSEKNGAKWLSIAVFMLWEQVVNSYKNVNKKIWIYNIFALWQTEANCIVTHSKKIYVSWLAWLHVVALLNSSPRYGALERRASSRGHGHMAPQLHGSRFSKISKWYLKVSKKNKTKI